MNCFCINYSCPLDSFGARKTRDTLMKSIYKHLIHFILSSINKIAMFENHECDTNVSILDVAGFGNIFKSK